MGLGESAPAASLHLRRSDASAQIFVEDTNGDGSLDSRKVFAEGLNLVSGLEVGFGGVKEAEPPRMQHETARLRNLAAGARVNGITQ